MIHSCVCRLGYQEAIVWMMLSDQKASVFLLLHYQHINYYPVTLLTPLTVACQAPLSMEFSRQEYWSGWPLPSPGHLPDPGTEPVSPILQEDPLPSDPPGKPLNNYQFLFCISF